MSQLSTKLPWELAQTKWPAALNPVLANPLLAGNQIDNIAILAAKPNAINHLLGRPPIGWIVVDNIANSVIWRVSPFSATTLTLAASVDTTISLWVF